MTLTKKQTVEILEQFITNKGSDWDWDDFISIKQKDPEIEKIRQLCAELPERFPPIVSGNYCNEKGLEVLKKILIDLKS